MKLWWDLVSPDGYGYQWGRSLGVVSYLDTLEIVAFLAANPSLRPAPIADLASAYRLAWRWLHDNYDGNRHMLSVFAPGRGNYAYITKEREWQQNVGFFGKALVAHDTLMRVLAAERVVAFPEHPALPAVARFEFFRRGDRPAGVWLVRQGALSFALPITTGTRPGIADYLPAPHGLIGFVAPVEQLVPAGAPYFEMADGRTLAAGDGADAIEPGDDGRSLRVDLAPIRDCRRQDRRVGRARLRALDRVAHRGYDAGPCRDADRTARCGHQALVVAALVERDAALLRRRRDPAGWP